jgi:hypothetical protein
VVVCGRGGVGRGRGGGVSGKKVEGGEGRGKGRGGHLMALLQDLSEPRQKGCCIRNQAPIASCRQAVQPGA